MVTGEMSKRSFPTKMLWNIMEPVSQKAANLVILHDEACAGRPLPDLTTPVAGVVSAVENLLHVCSSLLKSSCDAILLEEMPLACHGVDVAGKGLLEAAQVLKETPTSDEGRRSLGKHIHGLLSSMVALLFAWDDSEVRYAVSSCQSLLSYICENLRLVVNEANLRPFNTSISASIISLNKRVRGRANDLISEQRASIILSCSSRLEELWKRLSTVLTKFVAASTAGSPPQCRAREILARGILVEGEQLIAALLAEDSPSSFSRLREETTAWMSSQGTAGRGESRPVWQLIRKARTIAGSMQDAREHAQIVHLAEEVEDLVTMEVLGLRLADEERSEKTKEKIAALLAACEASGDRNTADDAFLDDVEKFLCGDLKGVVTEMLDVARDTSLSAEERQAKFEAVQKDFQQRCKEIVRTADRLAAAESRVDLKSRNLDRGELLRLRELSRTLTLESEMVAEACRELCVDPGCSEAQRQVEESAETWRQCAAAIEKTAQKAGGVALMAVVEVVAEKTARAAEEAAKNKDESSGSNNVTRFATLAQWAIDTAQIEVEQHDDERMRAKIADTVEQKTFSSASLTTTGSEMMSSGTPETLQKWRTESDNAISTMRSLRETLEDEGRVEEKEAEVVEEAAKEVEVKVEKKFDFPEPKQDETIMRAAHQLHSAASSWESTGNCLVAAAKRAAILLGELHAAAQSGSGNRKTLIETARALHAETASIVKEAQRIADDCTDKRIKTALLDLCSRLTTHNQQLKVVTAVKAAATGVEDDTVEEDAYEALSTNAEILHRGIADTLNLAEAASVRIRVDSGSIMRWIRRN